MEKNFPQDNSWGKIQTLTENARKKFDNEEYKEALEDINEAIKLGTDDAKVYFNKGLILDKFNSFKEAIKAFEEATKREPENLDMLKCLAVDYTRVWSYNIAESIFNRIIKIDPTYEPAYCNLITLYSEMEDFEEAEAAFYTAQDIDPECPVCWYNMGNILFTRMNLPRALLCLNESIKIDDRTPGINHTIARAHWANGDIEERKHYLMEEITKAPGNINARIDLGYIKIKDGELESAERAFNYILELNPKNAHAKMYLGEIELKRNNIPNATELFCDEIELDKNIPGPRLRLAEIYFKEGKVKKAEELLLEEKKICRNANYYPREASLLAISILTSIALSDPKRHKHNNDAMDAILTHLEKYGEDSKAFYYMSLCIEVPDNKKDVLDFALELNPNDPHIITELALLQAKKQKQKAALKLIKTLDSKNRKEYRGLKWKIWLSKYFPAILKTVKTKVPIHSLDIYPVKNAPENIGYLPATESPPLVTKSSTWKY